MHSHQRLHVFLPRLHAELVRNGMSRDTAKFTCKAMRAGAGPPIIKTLEDYRQGWILYHSMEDILTTMDEGSDAAAW